MNRTFLDITARRLLPWAAVLIALPSLAQYKVVGPDGKVTYTDRPPATATAPGAKVSNVRSNAGAAAADAALPIELRQAVQRFPVTLYVSTGCDPCNAGRDLLRQRGVPFAERTVSSNEDSDALAALTGSRDVPVLTIGAQTLRGLSAEVWGSYLDTAGYPRESRLPANFQFAAATPVVERRAATARPVTSPTSSQTSAEAPAATASGPAGIRF